MKIRIVIEDAQITLRSKTFEAASIEDAMRLAEQEDWSANDWEDFDSSSNCEIREDLSGPQS